MVIFNIYVKLPEGIFQTDSFLKALEDRSFRVRRSIHYSIGFPDVSIAADFQNGFWKIDRFHACKVVPPQL